MPSELEDLEAKARQLSNAAVGRPEAERAQRLAERLASRRFLIAVAGEFNRGKSTLVNALVGEAVVPTGVLPLTAVATELAFGEPGAVVEHLDGSRQAISPADLGEYVTEQRNPANGRQVARIEVRGRWPLLAPGAVLVDTPGIGSIHRHNTETARAELLDADGTVVVLSADSPLSEQERDLLPVLMERRAPTFFVLNRAGNLARQELDQVRRFVETALCDEMARKVRVYAIDSRAALEDCQAGRRFGDDAGEFAEFVGELERFIAEDLSRTRMVMGRQELARLEGSFRDALVVELAALELDAATLARQAELFKTEASRQRQAFEDDRTLLVRDVSRLVGEFGQRLAAFARAEPGVHVAHLAKIAEEAPQARLHDELRVAIEAAVRTSFEAFRPHEEARVEKAWEAVAERFRARTEERVDAVRQSAAQLFAVPLPRLDIPAVAAQRERFSYLFVHVGTSTEAFGRVAGRLVPGPIARRKALSWARDQLAREYDKHSGRARWDLSQRFDDVRRSYEKVMRVELDSAIEAILGAACRADELHRAADEERRQRVAEAARQRTLAAELTAFGDEVPAHGRGALE